MGLWDYGIMRLWGYEKLIILKWKMGDSTFNFQPSKTLIPEASFVEFDKKQAYTCPYQFS